MTGRIFRHIAVRLAHGVYGRRGLIVVGAIVLALYLLLPAINASPDLMSMSPIGGQSSNTYVASDGEPASTVSYIRGQKEYDAHLVWDAYSERFRRDFQQRGGGIEDLQRRLERSKQLGTRIEQAHYVGSYPIPNGKMAFYVVAQSAGSRNGVAYVPYTFTLDASGKIDKVE
jgi:hypothetical protein